MRTEDYFNGNENDEELPEGKLQNNYRAGYNYGIIPPGILYDPLLSAAAKGLWAYLYSRPDDSPLSIPRIALDFNDDEETLAKALKELIDHNYITKQPIMDEKGEKVIEWEYCIEEIE